MEAEIEERGQAPVAPPPAEAGKKRRKPPVRGRKGGRTAGKFVHLTEAENAQLEARARACGLSVSSYLRAAALGDAGPRARRAPTVQAEVIARAMIELNRVGNNVNQIARSANIGKEIDPYFYEAIGKQLVALLREMHEAIRT